MSVTIFHRSLIIGLLYYFWVCALLGQLFMPHWIKFELAGLWWHLWPVVGVCFVRIFAAFMVFVWFLSLEMYWLYLFIIQYAHCNIYGIRSTSPSRQNINSGSSIHSNGQDLQENSIHCYRRYRVGWSTNVLVWQASLMKLWSTIISKVIISSIKCPVCILPCWYILLIE